MSKTLYLSPTSPYTRMIVIMAMLEQIDLDLVFVNPWQNPEQLIQVNPFSQVPTLVLEQGEVITETLLIIQALAPQILHFDQLPHISQSFTVLNQAVKAFSTAFFAENKSEPHPFVARAEQFLSNSLPHLPILNPHSQQYCDIFLACTLHFIQRRLPDLFEKVSVNNQQALSIFLQQDFMQKTATEVLEQKPASILHLRTSI